VHGVDAAPHDLQVLESGLAQLARQRLRGHEGRVRLVVEAPQIVVHDGRQPAEAVVAAVLVEIRAEIRRDRNFEHARSAQRRPAERALGGHVHELRLRALEARAQRAAGREAQPQLRVHRDRAAERAPFPGRVQCCFAGLPRTDQLHRVSPQAQVLDSTLDGQRHAVELWRERLGHEGNAHGRLSAEKGVVCAFGQSTFPAPVVSARHGTPPAATPSMDWEQFRDHLRSWDVELFTLGGVQLSLSTVVKLAILLALLWWAAERMRLLIVGHALDRTHFDPGTRQAVGSVTRYVVLVVGVVLILQNAGVDLSALGWLAGAIGVGVGFGLQNVVSNFISGLIIMVERPFKIGDRIEIGSVEGVVQDIGARRTTVLTEDRLAILVPNQRFILDNVTNQVYSEAPIRLRIAVQVPSSTDPELMRRLLCDAAAAHPNVLKEPPPETLIRTLGGPSTQYELAVWHEARGPLRPRLASELNFMVGEKLRSNDIKGA
jgi:small-conductance mechanosensitive channel